MGRLAIRRPRFSCSSDHSHKYCRRSKRVCHLLDISWTAVRTPQAGLVNVSPSPNTRSGSGVFSWRMGKELIS